MKQALSLLALAALFAFPPSASAEVGKRSWRPIRIGLLPSESFVRVGSEVFEESGQTRRARAGVGAWTRRIEERLRGLDLVRVVDTSNLRENLESMGAVRQTLSLARERFELAQERYRMLELEPASTQLDRALELMIDGWSDITDPRAISDVHLYRGLAMMDRGMESEAVLAFRSMWLHDPSRRFQAGYYPATTEKVMARALDDLVSSGDLVGARYPAARLTQLVRATKVDALIAVALRKGPNGPELRVTIFDGETRLRTLDLREAIVDEARALDVVDRALSRWQSCAIRSEQRTYVSKSRPRRWSVDLSYGHALFLKHDRTRQMFASPGANIDVTYRAGGVLHLFAQMNHMVSVPDGNRDLLETMMTSRLAFGAGLGNTIGRFEPFARVGVEVGATLSDAKMTRDVNCKHFADPPGSIDPSLHPCDPGQIFTVESPAFVAGLHAGLGFRWNFVSRWHALVSAQLAAYVVDADFPVEDLNFPLTLSGGVGHRF